PWGKPAQTWLRRHYFLMADAGLSEPTPCAAVQGACLMTRRETWTRVGPLDAQRFFLYWEETDYCRRARALGETILVCPRLRCAHEGGASVAEGRQDTNAFWRSAHAYFQKHQGPLAAAAWLRMVSALTSLHLALLAAADARHPSRRAVHAEFRNQLQTRRSALRRALSGRAIPPRSQHFHISDISSAGERVS
ncbi:MAG: glycosyltransferase family 2 protein, partial [Kiritimatiellae bacterium]|nr:glycosyltransferase family 2 protein [Kiritimatiellia bacterium]